MSVDDGRSLGEPGAGLLSWTAGSVPLGPVVVSPICHGRTQHFVRSSDGELSTVHRHDDRGPAEVRGRIRDKWYELGAESGVLGCPTGVEQPCADGTGRCSEFVTADAAWAGLRADGVIVCRADGTTHEIRGAIWHGWVELGSVEGLGYPVSGQFTCDDGVGLFSQFRGARRARLYLTPSGGLRVVGDPFLAAWQAIGLEAGPLGYPAGDEHHAGGVRVLRFERGAMSWSAEHGMRIRSDHPE
jgi:uncharacterized protein with LGFP repeats